MKVGVDAQHLVCPTDGVSCYIHELSKLLLQRADINLSVYTPKPFLLYKGMQVKESNKHLKMGRFSRAIWSQTNLPLNAIYDEVDLFWGASHRLPVFLPSKIAKVVTVHDLVYKFAGETMRNSNRIVESFLLPHAIYSADLLMADSQKTADDIRKIFPSAAHKIRIVYPGTKKFKEELPQVSLAGFGISKPYILFVGTLEPRKNLTRLLVAYSRLPANLKMTTQIVIAGGNGWGGINLRAEINRLGLMGLVVILGYVEEKLLATLYRHCLFLAMPSIYEGFGFPVVEAMSFGKAVLVGGGSLNEIAGAAGICVNPLDENSIVDGLINLLDPAIRSDIEKIAISNANGYDWEQTAQQVKSVFEEALDLSFARKVKVNKFKGLS